jgi:vacuole morphology and inheritance protein 14
VNPITRSVRIDFNVYGSKYLSDPTEDVRVATENLMADFLKEIRDISELNNRREARKKRDPVKGAQGRIRGMESDEQLPNITVEYTERGGAFIPDHDGASSFADGESVHQSQGAHDENDLGGNFPLADLYLSSADAISNSAWNRGQDVFVDHTAIVEILIQQLDDSRKHRTYTLLTFILSP